jgi:hypothetical protein
MQGLIHWNPECTTPTASIINTADINITTTGFQKQQLVIRFRALYNADHNVSHSFPSQLVKPQICIIQSPI